MNAACIQGTVSHFLSRLKFSHFVAKRVLFFSCILGCPMHSKTPDRRLENRDDVPAHQERAYEFVACPVKSGASQVKDDIDPSNMVTFAYLRCLLQSRFF